MPDMHGRPLRAGDRVIHSSTAVGLRIGRLLFDEEARKSYHIKTDEREKPFFINKPDRSYKKDLNDSSILNLTLYVQEQLDKGLLDLVN